MLKAAVSLTAIFILLLLPVLTAGCFLDGGGNSAKDILDKSNAAMSELDHYSMQATGNYKMGGMGDFDSNYEMVAMFDFSIPEDPKTFMLFTMMGM